MLKQKLQLRCYIVLCYSILCLLTGARWLEAEPAKPAELRKPSAATSEAITISSSMPMDRAVELIGELARKFTGKIVIEPSGVKTPIGIDIVGMNWIEALDRLARTRGMKVMEGREYYILLTSDKESGVATIAPERALLDTREAMISVLFFEMNGGKLEQQGLSWSFLSNGADAINMTAADGRTGFLQAEVSENFDFGGFTAKLKAMASDQKGKLLASPQIIVQSGREGRIQIGSDFSVTTKDYSGNTITQFFSTGSIITVTPQIITVDSMTFIHLELEVQKSNANNSELGIEIKKTSAQTAILLLNGEETLIGGLYYDEKSESREGVPILKDLPWWALGIRYLTGYETSSIIRKELIVILRAEILPGLKERFAAKKLKVKEQRTLETTIQSMEKRLEGYIDQVK